MMARWVANDRSFGMGAAHGGRLRGQDKAREAKREEDAFAHGRANVHDVVVPSWCSWLAWDARPRSLHCELDAAELRLSVIGGMPPGEIPGRCIIVSRFIDETT